MKWFAGRRTKKLEDELAAILKADTTARTDLTSVEMMEEINMRAQRIAEIRIEISKINGTYELRKTPR